MGKIIILERPEEPTTEIRSEPARVIPFPRDRLIEARKKMKGAAADMGTMIYLSKMLNYPAPTD